MHESHRDLLVIIHIKDEHFSITVPLLQISCCHSCIVNKAVSYIQCMCQLNDDSFFACYKYLQQCCKWHDVQVDDKVHRQLVIVLTLADRQLQLQLGQMHIPMSMYLIIEREKMEYSADMCFEYHTLCICN